MWIFLFAGFILLASTVVNKMTSDIHPSAEIQIWISIVSDGAMHDMMKCLIKYSWYKLIVRLFTSSWLVK